mmetsp:Transcript_1407/g.2907  ORF Transcript_1407/g.2907 Transcript_1407/m.2907 type:complete len:333 (-) Transcript_1407:290-1288(-)
MRYRIKKVRQHASEVKHIPVACGVDTPLIPLPALPIDVLGQIICAEQCLWRRCQLLRISRAWRDAGLHTPKAWSTCDFTNSRNASMNRLQTTLILTDSDFLHVVRRAAAGLQHVKVADANKLTDAAIAGLGDCTELRTASFGGCTSLTIDSLHSLENMEQLEHLNMSEWNLNDDSLTTLKKFKHLTHLDLSCTAVTASQLISVLPASLVCLKLEGCSEISQSGLERLRARMERNLGTSTGMCVRCFTIHRGRRHRTCVGCGDEICGQCWRDFDCGSCGSCGQPRCGACIEDMPCACDRAMSDSSQSSEDSVSSSYQADELNGEWVRANDSDA